MRRAIATAAVLGAAVVVGLAARADSPVAPAPASTTQTPATSAASRCVVRQVAGLYVPDPACTPGAVDDSVTRDGPPYKDTLYAATICKDGWATARRKALFPLTASERVKATSVREYGAYVGASLRGYELDHLIPVSLGGEVVGTTAAHPNLWAEAPSTPNWKDRVEAAANRWVCHGLMPLERAQHLMAADPVQLGEVVGVLDAAGRRAVEDPGAATGGGD